MCDKMEEVLITDYSPVAHSVATYVKLYIVAVYVEKI